MLPWGGVRWTPESGWDAPCRAQNPGLTYNSVAGKFMVMVNDTDTARKVFSVNEPGRLLMAVHPSAKNILGPANLAFMHGTPHKVPLPPPSPPLPTPDPSLRWISAMCVVGRSSLSGAAAPGASS